MKNTITSKVSGLNRSVSLVLVNGSIVGKVTKVGTGKWFAQAEATGSEHIVVTAKTKKEAMENMVHAYLTEGREGY